MQIGKSTKKNWHDTKLGHVHKEFLQNQRSSTKTCTARTQWLLSNLEQALVSTSTLVIKLKDRMCIVDSGVFSSAYDGNYFACSTGREDILEEKKKLLGSTSRQWYRSFCNRSGARHLRLREVGGTILRRASASDFERDSRGGQVDPAWTSATADRREQSVDAPQCQEEIVEVVRFVPQDQVQRTDEQIVVVACPANHGGQSRGVQNCPRQQFSERSANRS